MPVTRKEEEESVEGRRRRQSRGKVRKSKVRGFGPRLERFGGRMSALSSPPLPCLISWRIVREESIVFGTVNQGEENWLLITAVGNFKIVNGTSGRVLGMIGGDLSLLWW